MEPGATGVVVGDVAVGPEVTADEDGGGEDGVPLPEPPEQAVRVTMMPTTAVTRPRRRPSPRIMTSYSRDLPGPCQRPRPRLWTSPSSSSHAAPDALPVSSSVVMARHHL